MLRSPLVLCICLVILLLFWIIVESRILDRVYDNEVDELLDGRSSKEAVAIVRNLRIPEELKQFYLRNFK